MAQKEAHRIRADALLLLPKQNQKHRRALFFSSGNNLSVSTTFVLSLSVLVNGRVLHPFAFEETLHRSATTTYQVNILNPRANIQ